MYKHGMKSVMDDFPFSSLVFTTFSILVGIEVRDKRGLWRLFSVLRRVPPPTIVVEYCINENGRFWPFL